jgi:hypothetical protein
MRIRLWLRHLALPVALHLALCLGLYQVGFSRDEMQRLRIDGPSHLIDAYVKAAQLYGPWGIVRAYFRGESDERLYLEYARLLLQGRLDLAYVADRQNDKSVLTTLPARAWPYRDVRVEYPPLAFLGFVPAAWLSTDYTAYRRGFIAYMLCLHFLNLWLAYRLLRPCAGALEPRMRAGGRLLYASLAFFCALGSVVVTRMDHLAVCWTLLSLFAFQQSAATAGRVRLGWTVACGVSAAFGIMTKLVPGLALFAILITWLRGRAPERYRLALIALGSCVACLVALNASMLALVGARYLDTFRYHGLRGVQIESVYSGVLLLLRPLGVALRVEESFGSTNLATSATAFVKQLSPCLFVVGAAYVSLARDFGPNARGATLLTSVLLILFMLTNRVFSPQYLIWVAAPLCALAVLQPGQWRSFGLFLGAVLISQLIFPRGYPMLKAFHPLAIALLNLRNLLLAAFALRLIRALSSSKAEAPS